MSQLDTVPTDFALLSALLRPKASRAKKAARIVLEGLPNTRDVGGLPTDDGRYVKHARLLRSGALDHATARDLEVLLDDYQVRTAYRPAHRRRAQGASRPTGGLVGVRSRMRRC